MSRSPRRRSAPSKKRSASGGISTVALALGVITAGLGIGALVSAFAHRGDDHAAIASPTPTVQPTPTPLPVIVPTATPTAEPTATPKPKKTPRATPTPGVTPTPQATPSPTSSASASPTPAASPSLLGKRTPQPAPTMRVVAATTATPAPTPSPKPTLAATVPPPRVVPPPPPPPATAAPAEATPAGEGGFPQAASTAVRRYLSAVIAGNTERASGYLGPGAGTGDEPSMLDRSAAITAVHARSTSPTTAHVEVDLSSSKGALFATYDVTQTPAGPRITNHEIIKP